MNNQNRKQQSRQLRENAAELAYSRTHPEHVSNGEEQQYRDENNKPSHIASFTKGLPHDTEYGLLLSNNDFQQFVLGIQDGTYENFKATPLGPGQAPNQPTGVSTPSITGDTCCCETPKRNHCKQACPCDSVKQEDCECKPGKQKGDCDHPRAHIWKSAIAKTKRGADKCCGADVRAWESQAGGNLFDLQGPDAHAVTMPPAPTIDSDELAAEMTEVYLQALLRDVHFSHLRDAKCGPVAVLDKKCQPCLTVDDAAKIIESTPWFKKECCDLSPEEQARHRQQFDRQTLFRGQGKGVDKGPYISQFLLIGNEGFNEGDDCCKGRGYARCVDDGKISYGAITIDQRVRVAEPCKDYMTTFEAWVDVQNGANLIGCDSYVKGHPKHRYRFISTPRDLATYVHHDQLYEAYLNAALILLGMKAPFDPGLPFIAQDVYDHQQGFASFGGPHLLTLVTEVATRALKAVRHQKFNIHRRARPEALGGLIDRLKSSKCVPVAIEPIGPLANALNDNGVLDLVMKHNKNQNTKHKDRACDDGSKVDSCLLPMAFPEGSPMHPSYGAGHATVAGACVTILKAFFDHAWKLPLYEKTKNSCRPIAYEADSDGCRLNKVDLKGECLTVEGELNKLAANISIGRDWAGVHYYTDYIESLRMGEKIALGILEEQRLCYPENFTMTVPLFDGGVVRI